MKKSILTKKVGGELSQVFVASSFWERFKGLMLKKIVSDSDVIVFPRCSSIHTFFMLANIDVVFIGTNGLVVKVFESLKPWRILWPIPSAIHCIEMRSQRARLLGISEGDVLTCEGVF